MLDEQTPNTRLKHIVSLLVSTASNIHEHTDSQGHIYDSAFMLVQETIDKYRNICLISEPAYYALITPVLDVLSSPRILHLHYQPALFRILYTIISILLPHPHLNIFGLLTNLAELVEECTRLLKVVPARFPLSIAWSNVPDNQLSTQLNIRQLTLLSKDHATSLVSNINQFFDSPEMGQLFSLLQWFPKIITTANFPISSGLCLNTAQTEQTLLAMDPSDPDVHIFLERYLICMSESDGASSIHLFASIVHRFWFDHSSIVSDLITISIESFPSEPSVPSLKTLEYTLHSEPGTPSITISYSGSLLPSVLVNNTCPFALFCHVMCALLATQRIVNPVSAIAFIARHDSESGILTLSILDFGVQYLDKDALELAFYLATITLINQQEAELDPILVDAAHETMAKHGIEFKAKDVSVAQSILKRIPYMKLHDHMGSWYTAPSVSSNTPNPPLQRPIPELINDLNFNTLAEICAQLQTLTIPKRLETLHPVWAQLVSKLSDANAGLIRITFHAISTLLDCTSIELLDLTKKYTFPAAMKNMGFGSALSSIADKSVNGLITEGLEYILCDIIVTNAESEWVHKFNELEEMGLWHETSLKDVLSINARLLVTLLVLEQHEQGIRWVHAQSEQLTTVDWSLSTLVHLTDALVLAKWKPNNPSPCSALSVLEWLVRRAGQDVRVLATQAISLALAGVSEFPLKALAVWVAVVEVAEDSALIHVWPYTVHAVSQSPSVIKLLNSEDTQTGNTARDLLDRLFSRASTEVLEEMPNIPSEILELAQYQSRITESKKGFSLDKRIENMLTRFSYPELVVAQAAIRELTELLTSLIHTGQSVTTPHDLIRMLVNVADHHPDLIGSVINCLGKLGATELCDQVEPVPNTVNSHKFVEISSANHSSSSTALDYINQSVPNFCVILLTKALIPYLKTTESMVNHTMIAYAIQNFLKYFKQACLSALDKLDLDTVAPFLHSKYLVTVDTQKILDFDHQKIQFKAGDLFPTWICGTVLSLIKYVKDPELILVLRAVTPLLFHIQHHPVASLLLPFLTVNLCVNDNKDAMDLLAKEFYNVLDQTPKHTSAHPCARVVLESLHRVSTWQRQDSRSSKKYAKSTPVSSFLGRLPSFMIARAAEKLGQIATAAFYFETAIKPNEKTPNFEKYESELGLGLISTFQNLDAGDRGDYTSGAMQLIANRDRTLEINALQHAIKGDWDAVLTVYTSKLQDRESGATAKKGVYRAMIELGYYEILSEQVELVCDQAMSDNDLYLSDSHLDALAKLGDWDSLETVTENSNLETVSINNLYVDMKLNNQHTFRSHLDIIQHDIFKRLQFGHCTSALIQCHVLTDICSFNEQVINLSDATISTADWLQECETRLLRTTKLYNVRHDILSNLRSTVMLADDLRLLPNASVHLQSLWLQSAALVMADGRNHLAYSYLLRAEPPSGSICYAYERQMVKWLAINKSKQKALDRLNDLNLPLLTLTAVPAQVLYNVEHIPTDPAFEKARLQLLQARFMADVGSSSTKTIMNQFLSVCATKLDWDKAYYHAGRFHHHVYKSLREAGENEAVQLSHLKSTIQHWAKALLVGTKYTYLVLPQILTLWMNLATSVASTKNKSDMFFSIHSIVSKLCTEVPPYILSTIIPQVTSRLTHSSPQVFEVLTIILKRLIIAYPGQVLWHLASSFKSADALRNARMKSVIDHALLQAPSSHQHISTLVAQMRSMTQHFIKLCNVSLPKEVSTFSLNQVCSGLTRKSNFDKILIPIDAQLTGKLPTKSAHQQNYFPFGNASNQVTIHGFADQVELMSSLVRPKKLRILGSDGNEYVFLCKPKDDLRKDARLMELTARINTLLNESQVATSKRLYMRRYAVTPLNEECGLIEWVPNTTALRHILKIEYRNRYRQLIYNPDIQALFSDTSNLHANFKKLQTLFPPVLQDWFIDAFTTYTEWFNARQRFTRTCAVVSMIGYVIGLGDRHLENILLDVKTGDAVHVDFNCLFDKGKSFAKPETVPFRLTQNMVAAFGCLGIEGPFRHACEIVMQTLRENRESLMIVLETFLHDPLIEWKSRKSSSKQQIDAPKLLAEIDRRLQGKLTEGLPHGVNGQVSELIRQATSTENLCRMYEGWMPYL